MPDRGGHYSYSNIVALTPIQKYYMNVFPNPVGDILLIKFRKEIGEQASLQIFDMEGVILKQQLYSAMNGATYVIVNTLSFSKASTCWF